MFRVVVENHNYCLVNDYVFEKLLFTTKQIKTKYQTNYIIFRRNYNTIQR